MKITCNRTEIISMADPARIIDTDIITGMVTGVPTVMVQPDTLLRHKDRVRDLVDDMVADTVAAAHRKLGWGTRLMRFFKGPQHPFAQAAHIFPRSLAQAFKAAQTETGLCGMPMPVALVSAPGMGDPPDASADGRDAYRRARAALVTLPSTEMKFEDIFKYKRGFSRLGCPEIDPGATVFRYGVTCHEIGHVAGGAEAQADMVAALFTRRAFGDTPMPQMLADFRALDVITTGVNRLNGITAAPGNDNRYGWEMVEAADAACAVPLAALRLMTDEDILDGVFIPARRDHERTQMMISLLFHTLAEPPAHRHWHIAEIAQATRMMKIHADALGDRPLIGMVARLDLAARRVMGGNAAYGI